MVSGGVGCPPAGLVVRAPAQGLELSLDPGDPPMVIGRDPASGVVFTSQLVSARHARVSYTAGSWVIDDLGSTNGSFVGGVQQRSVAIVGRTQIHLGDPVRGELLDVELSAATADVVSATSPGSVLATTTGRRPTSTSVFAAHDLTVDTNGRRRLDRVSFALPAGAMLGVLGGSGAGKSTLVKAITGSDPATSGIVVFEGHDLYRDYRELRRRIGYVPQDDILHTSLTVESTLEYGTQLRMPGASPSERAARATEVLDELGLGHRTDALVSELSGGQRKRLNVALELLSRPPLLILDEPTSGLDPANERGLMQLLRQLADGGRTVIVVTHSTESLHLCDDVLVLARGGVPAYLGPADGFAQTVGQSTLIDAFGHVDNHPQPDVLRSRFDAAHSIERPEVSESVSAPQSRTWIERFAAESGEAGANARVLIRRSVDIIRGDRRNAMILAGQAPVIAILLILLFNGAVLDVDNNDPSGSSLLLAIVLAVIFIGAAGSVREIVKERSIMLREQAIGVPTSAYVASKIVVLGTILLAQSLLIVVMTTMFASGPRGDLLGIGAVSELALVVALSGLVAAAFGLAISAVVNTNDKAMTLLPVFLFVQLLLAGLIVPVHEMPMRILSWFVASKWGLDGAGAVGQIASLGPKCEQQPDECSANWQHETGNLVLAVVALTVMLGAAIYLTHRALERNDPARVLVGNGVAT